jgi:hypothetical protein
MATKNGITALAVIVVVDIERSGVVNVRAYRSARSVED